MGNHPNRINRYHLVKDDNSCTIYDGKGTLNERGEAVAKAVKTFNYYDAAAGDMTAGDTIRRARRKLDSLNAQARP